MADDALRGRTALVTGGCGFIGSHLVHALLGRGVAGVVALDSMRCGDPANVGSDPRVEVVRFELGVDPDEALAAALRGVDHVFHLAAEKHQASRDRPRELLRHNLEGTHQLLDAAVVAGVKKVVFSSSLYAYGRTSGPPMREDETPRPTTVYGISKLAGEHLLAHFLGRHGLAYVALRYFFVYGPRQFAGQGYKSVIVKTCERLLAGEAPVLFGDGLQALDYSFIDDVVEATLRAMESDVSGEVINVGSGVATPVAQVVELLREIAGNAAPARHDPPDETAGTSRVAATDKARTLLGFTTTTALRTGLERTYRWIESQRDSPA